MPIVRSNSTHARPSAVELRLINEKIEKLCAEVGNTVTNNQLRSMADNISEQNRTLKKYGDNNKDLKSETNDLRSIVNKFHKDFKTENVLLSTNLQDLSSEFSSVRKSLWREIDKLNVNKVDIRTIHQIIEKVEGAERCKHCRRFQTRDSFFFPKVKSNICGLSIDIVCSLDKHLAEWFST